MISNPYIEDILSQPAALRRALENYPAEKLAPLRERILRGEFSRIVLTGMGSSYNAAYPAWLKLLALPVPVIQVNTAELLHYGQAMLDERTLLWVNSQSGRSVEILRLLEGLKQRPAFQLSMTNDMESPMAKSADLAVEIHAGPEHTVSTKTFVNMEAVLMLAAAQLAAEDWRALRKSMLTAAAGMQEYLSNLDDRVTELERLLGIPDQALIVGRGASMAAVWNASLVNKEAAKEVMEGMNVADFRHGPMELASARLTLLILEGAPATAGLNHNIGKEVLDCGGRVIWIASSPSQELPTLLLPAADEAARPLVEIVPFQVLSLLNARRNGFEPGKFRHIGKVTTAE